MKTKYVAFLIVSFIFQIGRSQSVVISGKVESNISVENINIINEATRNFALTNARGEFEITAKLNDTLQFFSMLHKTKYVVIDKNILLIKAMNVNLDEQVYELNEVKVGNLLTGNLFSDIKSIEGKPPINFYDVGIPGYTGKVATQSERRLWQANGEGTSYKVLIPQILGGSVPLDPIINGISGRTKKLRGIVETEEKENLMQSIKGRLGRDFFASNSLDDDLKMDFFYFCADDERFMEYCKNQTDFKIMTFLRMKYLKYLENLTETKD